MIRKTSNFLDQDLNQVHKMIESRKLKYKGTAIRHRRHRTRKALSRKEPSYLHLWLSYS